MNRVLILAIVVIFSACTKNETTSHSSDSSDAPVISGGEPTTLNGKVTFDGKAPKAKPIKMSADPVCLKANKTNAATSENLVVNESGGLANVFVYVKGNFEAPPASSLSPVELDQDGCRYTPHVVGIQTGQTLRIKNSDPTLHNVNAQAKSNSGFNVGMATKGQTVDKSFSKPEVVKFKCDVHGWMSAYVGVVKHPYFAVTDETGAFTIANVPAGDYTLVLWHEKLGEKEQPVTVAASATPVDFKFVN